MFVSLLGVTWGAVGLSGQVMVERSYNEMGRAHSRAKLAQQSLSAIRGRVNRLTEDKSVIHWAETHGMALPDANLRLVSSGNKAGDGPVD